MRPLRPRRRHPLAALAVLLVGLVVTGGAYAAISAPQGAQAVSAQSFAVDLGRKLYLQGCSTCHGLSAEGTTDGPTLIGVGAAAVDFQVSTGRMPLQSGGVQAPRKPRAYDETQVDQLAAYVASLGPGPAIPSAEQLDLSDANLQEGGELFRTNCASCHNFVGQGGALTRGKYAPDLAGVSSRTMYEAMLTGPQSMPVFSDTSLTPEQKRAIIAFVQNVQEEPNPGGFGLGRVGPVSEGLVTWTVGLGLIIAAAVWIAVKPS